MSDLFLGIAIGAFAATGLWFYTVWRFINLVLTSDMAIAHETRRNWSKWLDERERNITHAS
jgi:hypothetical protein